MKTGFSLGSAREGAVQGFKGYNTVGTVGMARSACLAEFDQMATERERPALFAVIISQFTGFFWHPHFLVFTCFGPAWRSDAMPKTLVA